MSSAVCGSDALKEADQLPHDAPERTPDYLAMLRPPRIPPHQLDIKVDAVCTIQRNLSVNRGLVHNVGVRITAVVCGRSAHRPLLPWATLHCTFSSATS
ncbi:hypothetical protein BKA83DRAFT_4258481 [Pisolithus microcarpus]|nr:hypothetical protein BKA83DRAFT_4258481 [Pisolithus microcarpus]